MKKSVLKDISKLSPDAQTVPLKASTRHSINGTRKCFAFHGLGRIAGNYNVTWASEEGSALI